MDTSSDVITEGHDDPVPLAHDVPERVVPLQRVAVELAFFDERLAAIPEAVNLLRAVLGGGLEAPVHIQPARWPDVFERMKYHRILPQFAQAVDGGRVVLSPQDRHELASPLVHLTVQSLKLEQVMIRVGRVFAEAGIPHLVLKGMATSQLDFPRPEHRTAVDIDVLIEEPDLSRAGAVLIDAGFRFPYGIESMMDKGQTWVDVAGWHLDLHTRLHAPARSICLQWWERAEWFEIGGVSFRALPRGGRLAHAASHLALSWPSARRFSSLLDLVVLTRSCSPADRRDAEALLREMGVSDIVHRITSRVASILDMPEIVLGSPAHRPLDLMLRHAYDRPDDEKISMKFSTFVGMPYRERVVVARNWIRPSPEFLERGRYRTNAERLISVAKRLGLLSTHVVGPLRTHARAVLSRGRRVLRWFGQARWRDRATAIAPVLLVPMVRVSLRLGGYSATRRRMVWRCRPERSDRCRSSARIAETSMRHLPLTPTCLERSLVVWWLLGGDEICDIKLGVAPAQGGGPPSFHAWVEVDGRVINDRADIAEHYLPFPDAAKLSSGRFGK